MTESEFGGLAAFKPTNKKSRRVLHLDFQMFVP